MTSAAERKSHSPGWLFCALLALLLPLSGCTDDGGAGAVKLSGRSMGTTWHVTYLPGDAAAAPEAVQAALEGELAAVNASMSTYREDSEISRFNRAPVGEWFAVSPDFLAVLEAALDIGRRSGGAYDVTVAPLVNLWGFGPGASQPQVPAAGAIDALRADVGQQHLEVDGSAARVRKAAALSLDFSSIAKGYAVDRLARYLRGQRIGDFLVEVGGEMRLAGRSPRGDRWRVAIERPSPGDRAVGVALSLSDVAVATSGDYRNYFEIDGRRYSHSIDPRTGYPVAHDLVSVTVVAERAMEADAWATALVVLGPDRAMTVASDQAMAVYFIRRQGEEFVATHTAAFAPYLDGQEDAAGKGLSGPER
jgi:thiamine biosynthesis lipoprotein